MSPPLPSAALPVGEPDGRQGVSHVRGAPQRTALTRYRDLYDLALMADLGNVDSEQLIDAVREQQQRRGLSIPRPLTPPSQTWPDEYDRAMRKLSDPNQRQRYATYEAAVAIVEDAIGAALDAAGPAHA
ncbi:MAG: nucleotidyl transferase AbiEii/AbiGii toxin family protein [Propionibacteriaceae bacterium]|nr:nucleotidyl transferase AbiEii/AbiGii toxin family protein [Propionibacteriaceae bacterium]